jgi:hypothetical protein
MQMLAELILDVFHGCPRFYGEWAFPAMLVVYILDEDFEI